jgi:hypothetical protein
LLILGGIGNDRTLEWQKKGQSIDQNGVDNAKEETDSPARQCEQWKEGGEVKECLPPATPPMPPRLLRWACALGFKSQEFPWDF